MNWQLKIPMFGLIFLAFPGCWEDMEGWSGSAVWSDDDTSVAGIYEYFEGRNTPTHLRKRNIESEVFLMTYGDDQEQSRRVMQRRQGRINDLFYMKAEGYLIVNREERLPDLDEGMNLMSRFYVDKVTLNGEVTSLGSRQALTMISCDAEGNSATTTGEVISAFPSPDGELVARVETMTTCQDQTVTITFLDAQTLQQLGEEFISARDVNGTLGITDYAWLESGRFAEVTTSIQGPRGASYAPNTDPQDLEGLAYECFFPATNSSDINAAGVYVSINDGRVDLSAPDPFANTFGCP